MGAQPELLSVIWRDLWAHKLQIFLVFFLVGSAFASVLFADNTRKLNSELERLRDRQISLNQEYRHLLLEENALAELSRVENLAKNKLDMIRPEPKDEIVIQLK